LGEALCYKPEGRGFDSRWGNSIILIDLILPAATMGLGFRNEYQESYWGVKGDRRVRLITSPLSVS
jgi:hypothetical protein